MIAEHMVDDDFFDDVTLRDIEEDVKVMTLTEVKIKKEKILANTKTAIES